MPAVRKPADRAVLAVSMPKAADRLIRRGAAKLHKSKSAFVRDAAIEAAQRVLTAAVPATEPANEPTATDAAA